MRKMCPGQDSRSWKPEDIFEVKCGNCSTDVEFFKDEVSLLCPKCKSRVQNPGFNIGCAQWCEHAKECLGFEPESVQLKTEDKTDTSLTDRLIRSIQNEVKHHNSVIDIDKAKSVFENVQEILKTEPGNPRATQLAALLTGIEYSMETGFGPVSTIATRIMENIGINDTTIEFVLKILKSYYTLEELKSHEYRIISDSVWLVENSTRKYGKEEVEDIIETGLKTKTGKKLANKLFLNI